MSVFADEWRKCLIEQYKYVVQADDRVTLQSLTMVLYDLGFSEDELRQLRVEATIRTEDNPDFVPDFSEFQPQAPPPAPTQAAFQPHPLECQCPSCVDLNLTPHDDEGQPIPPMPEEEGYDDDAPQQLSMF